jgi:hypothetical protein
MPFFHPIAGRKALVRAITMNCGGDATLRYLAQLALHTGIRPELLRTAYLHPTLTGTCKSEPRTVELQPCLDCGPCIMGSNGKRSNDAFVDEPANSSSARGLTARWKDKDSTEALQRHLAALRENLKD